MRHWLQAEQELANPRGGQDSGATPVPSRNSDVTPLQGTRAAAAATAGRDNKRVATSTPPFSGEKNGGGAPAAKRKPTSAPAL